MSRDDIDDESQWVPAEDLDREARASGEGAYHIYIGGEVVGNTFQIGQADGAHVIASGDSQKIRDESLAEQRQRFFFDFLQHSLQQAEWTFRLSVWFMSGGAAIILAGAVLALVHAGNPDLSYLPLVTSLTGALITIGGGALAVHARRARAHVTEQADRMDVKIDLDHKLETATGLIDRVDDPALRDRLNSAAAMKALDMQSTPDTMVDRLLPKPEEKPGELGSGNTAH
jgi:hypothetical protein